MTKATYVVAAPDGTEFTRTSHRTYTHAVLSLDNDGWAAKGFCGRADLAQKKQTEHPDSIIVECGILDKPKVVDAEATITEKRPTRTISSLTKELLMNANLGYGAIVDQVKAEFPGAKTTARSVASVASVERKKGNAVPIRRTTKG